MNTFSQTLDLGEFNALPTNSPAKHTFIFWINGDSDRFRPFEGTEKVVRLDKIDARKLSEFLPFCQCNALIFHDQRGSKKWFNNRKHFGSFLYAYSNGKKIKFKYKKRKKKKITWKETNQSDENFMVSLFSFAKRVFPNSKLHLYYRGHGIPSKNDMSEESYFDYSHKDYSFNTENLKNIIDRARVHFETITFAACSMATFEIIKDFQEKTKFLIASQVNISESVSSNFSQVFLKEITNQMDAKDIATIIGETSLLIPNTLTHNNYHLFVRERPLSVINMDKLKKIIPSISAMIREVNYQEELSKDKVFIFPSNNYIQYRKKQGASSKVLKIIKSKLKVASHENKYDVFKTLKRRGYLQAANKIKDAVKVFGGADFSGQGGISFTYSNPY